MPATEIPLIVNTGQAFIVIALLVCLILALNFD